jgi:hypothetical protein
MYQLIAVNKYFYLPPLQIFPCTFFITSLLTIGSLTKETSLIRFPLCDAKQNLVTFQWWRKDCVIIWWLRTLRDVLDGTFCRKGTCYVLQVLRKQRRTIHSIYVSISQVHNVTTLKVLLSCYSFFTRLGGEWGAPHFINTQTCNEHV